MKCPYCSDEEAQIKFGKNRSGSQKYRCKKCGRFHTPQPGELGYSEDKRLQAVRLYADGGNLRRVARHLRVSPQSVANWVKAYAARLPQAPPPQEVDVVEMDELHTFIEHKKKKAYIVTFVDRQTRCVLSWAVAFQADEDTVQGALCRVPQAQWYYSNAAPVYDGLLY